MKRLAFYILLTGAAGVRAEGTMPKARPIAAPPVMDFGAWAPEERSYAPEEAPAEAPVCKDIARGVAELPRLAPKKTREVAVNPAKIPAVRRQKPGGRIREKLARWALIGGFGLLAVGFVLVLVGFAAAASPGGVAISFAGGVMMLLGLVLVVFSAVLSLFG